MVGVEEMNHYLFRQLSICYKWSVCFHSTFSLTDTIMMLIFTDTTIVNKEFTPNDPY